MKKIKIIYKKYILAILLSAFIAGNINAQCLLNQDFSTFTPTSGHPLSCGGSVDVHNNGGSYWGVNEFSMDGNAYLGMHPELFGDANVAFEYMSFPLSSPMVSGINYSCSFYQAIGTLHGLGGLAFWASENLGNNPGYFNVYAGNSLCDTADLIFSSPLLNDENDGWLLESFSYTATNPYTHLTFVPLAPSAASLTPYMLLDDVQFCSTMVLPVELQSLQAEWMDKDYREILIHWKTVSETNCDYFIIEKSTNGKNWLDIGKVIGSGNSSITHSYFFPDYLLAENQSIIFYYRLKQVDTDGKSRYFGPVALQKNNSEQWTLNFNNPVSGNELLGNILTKNDINAVIEISDKTGKKNSAARN